MVAGGCRGLVARGHVCRERAQIDQGRAALPRLARGRRLPLGGQGIPDALGPLSAPRLPQHLGPQPEHDDRAYEHEHVEQMPAESRSTPPVGVLRRPVTVGVSHGQPRNRASRSRGAMTTASSQPSTKNRIAFLFMSPPSGNQPPWAVRKTYRSTQYSAISSATMITTFVTVGVHPSALTRARVPAPLGPAMLPVPPASGGAPR